MMSKEMPHPCPPQAPQKTDQPTNAMGSHVPASYRVLKSPP